MCHASSNVISATISNMMTVGTTSGIGIGTGIAKPSKTLHLTYVLVVIFCPFSLANMSDLVRMTASDYPFGTNTFCILL